MTKEEIIDFLRDNKEFLQKRYQVSKIALFGSYAKGCTTPQSDIDIAVEMQKKDFFLRDELREFLEQHLKKPVDLGYIDTFREFYKKRIENELIYV